MHETRNRKLTLSLNRETLAELSPNAGFRCVTYSWGCGGPCECLC